MVDIHSHVLPGLDDGARTLEESLEMLRMAAASGTTDIVATPHANSEFIFEEARVRSIFREVSELCSSFIRLHLGCDFYLNYENLVQVLRNPKRFTINQDRYLLVELPDIVTPSTVRSALRQLLNAGIVPIVTHPERNESIQSQVREMAAWRNEGCLLQVTGQSFLGRFGPHALRSAERLIAANLVDFVASDAHDPHDRSPELTPVYERIRSDYGAEAADKVLVENPAALIAGVQVYPIATRRRKTWLQKFFG